jgi:hypothetical protein
VDASGTHTFARNSSHVVCMSKRAFCMSTDSAPQVFANTVVPTSTEPFFSWTKRLLRPAFSDYALFSFLAFFVFFQCTVRYPSNPLPPSYMTHTSSRIFWSFHTSYRVCLVPAESGDSNSACSAGAVAARRQNGVAVPHTEGVGSRQCGAMPAQGGADLHGS